MPTMSRSLVPSLAALLGVALWPGAATAKCESPYKKKDGDIVFDPVEPFRTIVALTGKLKSGRFVRVKGCPKRIRRRTKVTVERRSACKWWGGYLYGIRWLRNDGECLGWVSARHLKLKGQKITVIPPTMESPAPGVALVAKKRDAPKCGDKGKEKSFPYCELVKFETVVRNATESVWARDSKDRTRYYDGLKKVFSVPAGARVEVFRRTTKRVPAYFRDNGKRRLSSDYLYKIRYALKEVLKSGWLHGHFLGPAPLYRARVEKCNLVAVDDGFKPVVGLPTGSVVEALRESVYKHHGSYYVQVLSSVAGKRYLAWVPQRYLRRVEAGQSLSVNGSPVLELSKTAPSDALGYFKQEIAAYSSSFLARDAIPAHARVDLVGESARSWGCVSRYFLVEYPDRSGGTRRRAWVRSLQLFEPVTAEYEGCRLVSRRRIPSSLEKCATGGAPCFFARMWSEYFKCVLRATGWAQHQERVAAEISRVAAACVKRERKEPQKCVMPVRLAFHRLFRSVRRGEGGAR